MSSFCHFHVCGLVIITKILCNLVLLIKFWSFDTCLWICFGNSNACNWQKLSMLKVRQLTKTSVLWLITMGMIQNSSLWQNDWQVQAIIVANFWHLQFRHGICPWSSTYFHTCKVITMMVCLQSCYNGVVIAKLSQQWCDCKVVTMKWLQNFHHNDVVAKVP